MAFVDTGVWYAGVVAEDPDHRRCRDLLSVHERDLVTTDYVVDEVLTLLTARGHRQIAVAIGADLWDGVATQLVHVSQSDLIEAWQIFRRYTDKRWSFTDCTSYAVMQRLSIRKALSLDDHFRQFGFVEVEP